VDPEGTQAAADAERERQRIAAIRGILEGGDEQPERGFFERLGIRRTNETGEGRPSTGDIREDIRELGRALGFKKGGQIKSKTMMKKGGKVMKYREGGPIRQGMQSPKAQEGRAEMAEDVMRRERAREPISDKERKAGRAEAGRDSGPLTDAEKERMRSSGFKKGGAIKPPVKKMMKGGMTSKLPPTKAPPGMRPPVPMPTPRPPGMRPPVPMPTPRPPPMPVRLSNVGGSPMMKPVMKKAGGKVTAKPVKKMMGGGRAMYAKGGMAKGCK
jgi:hypothetical protein